MYFEFLLMLALWINVLVGFILNNHNQLEDKVFRICQLGLSSVGVILTIIDLVHHWCRYGCKTCAKKTASIEWYNNTPNQFHLPEADCERKCCQIGCGYEIVDNIRFFVTPAIAYPLLLLSMFELLSQLVLCRTDVTTFLSFLLSKVSKHHHTPELHSWQEDSWFSNSNMVPKDLIVIVETYTNCSNQK